MRTDYILYLVALIFFVITGMVFAFTVDFKELWIVGTAVLGLFFAGLGYIQRPRMKAEAVQAPPPSTAIQVSPTAVQAPPQPITETAREPETRAVEETVTPTLEITQVKGVKAKRAEQLKSLGISGVQDLANASAKDLGDKLKVSPKITEKWIADAKGLLEKSKH